MEMTDNIVLKRNWGYKKKGRGKWVGGTGGKKKNNQKCQKCNENLSKTVKNQYF